MTATMSELLNLVAEFNHDERKALLSALQQTGDREKVCDLIEARQEQQRQCPHCHATHAHRHGKAAGIQRYKCAECGKTYNALTGTPLAHLHKKELWLQHLDLMLDSTVLRTVAKELSVDLKTAFRWRHRFAAWLGKDLPPILSGIVEADETYFLKSKKGDKSLTRPARKRGGHAKQRGLSKEQVCVVTSRDRSKHSLELISGVGPVKSIWLEHYLADRIADDALLVTDGLSSYAKFSEKTQLKHVVVKNRPGERVQGAFHIQNINAYHSRIKGWINGHFHGVSTKYLNHYLWLRHEIENKHISSASDLFNVSLNQIPQLTGT